MKNGEPVTVDVPAANDPSQPAQVKNISKDSFGAEVVE